MNGPQVLEALDRALYYLGGMDGVHSDAVDAREAVARMIRENEILHIERDMARAHLDRAVKILTGIHMLLSPPPHTNEKGMTFVFHSPLVHEQMQALSDRIRAIHDEIAAIGETP